MCCRILFYIANQENTCHSCQKQNQIHCKIYTTGSCMKSSPGIQQGISDIIYLYYQNHIQKISIIFQNPPGAEQCISFLLLRRHRTEHFFQYFPHGLFSSQLLLCPLLYHSCLQMATESFFFLSFPKCFKDKTRILLYNVNIKTLFLSNLHKRR